MTKQKDELDPLGVSILLSDLRTQSYNQFQGNRHTRGGQMWRALNQLRSTALNQAPLPLTVGS